MATGENFRLDDRMALVTGAAQGIGQAVALTLGGLGCRVAICDLEAPDETSRLLGERGVRCHQATLDVRDDEAVAAFVAASQRALGGLDIVVNNAGGGFASPFEGLSANAVDTLVRENFTSTASVIRHALPLLPDGAAIVNITSVEAHRAGPGYAVYSAMKAAVTNLTRSLAVELGPRRIRVNCVAPDLITTPGVGDMGRWAPLAVVGTSDHVADAVAFLASDRAGFTTGSVIHVDGGTHAAGGWHRTEIGTFEPARSLHSAPNAG